jgi:putative membrane protein
MKGFFLKWLVNIFVLLAVVGVIKGIEIDNWQTAVWAALILGLVNAFLKPLIILFTLPINIFSLGLFTLIINGFLLFFVSKIIEGFSIDSFGSAFWGALFFSIISFSLSLLIGSTGKISYSSRGDYPRRYNQPSDNNVIDVYGESEDD